MMILKVAEALRRRLDRRAAGSKVNFWCHVGEGTFIALGWEISSAEKTFALAATAMGATPEQIGWLMSLIAFGSLGALLQLLLVHRFESTRRKKPLLLKMGLGQRLPVLCMGLLLVLPWALGVPAIWCLIPVALCYTALACFNQLAGPPWVDLIAETIPNSVMARMMGYRMGISAVIGLLSASVAYAIVRAFPLPYNFGIVYLVGFMSAMLSWAIFAMVDDIPAHAEPKPRKEAKAYFRRLIKSVSRDRNYQYWLAYQCLEATAWVLPGFLMPAAARVHHIRPDVLLSSSILLGAVGKVLSGLVMPRLGERIGHKFILGISTLTGCCTALLAAMAPTAETFLCTFFLIGASIGMKWPATMPFSLRVFPRKLRMGYQTLSGLIPSPVAAIAYAVAGKLIMVLGYQSVFLILGAIGLLGLLPLSRCRMRRPGQVLSAAPAPAAAGETVA